MGSSPSRCTSLWMTPQDVAELLLASWVLSGPSDDLPIGQGALDRAVKGALEKGACPPAWGQELHFVDSRAGLRCAELEAVLDAAVSAELAHYVSPSFTTLRPTLSSRVARELLRHHEVSEADVRDWGTLLREALTKAEQDLSRLSSSRDQL